MSCKHQIKIKENRKKNASDAPTVSGDFILPFFYNNHYDCFRGKFIYNKL